MMLPILKLTNAGPERISNQKDMTIKMKKIYIVGHGWGYANWMEGERVDSMREADLVVFTGGEDIDPRIYGKQAHPATYFNRRRDRDEIEAFGLARQLGKKMIGICRGAQLLCALAGGTLVQNQNHPWIHYMKTKDGPQLLTNSMHHQRAFPWGGNHPNFELLGWAEEGLSPYNEGVDRKDNMQGHPEAEIVLYPNIKGLAIQGHPEMAYPPQRPWENDFIGYCRIQLDRLMEL